MYVKRDTVIFLLGLPPPNMSKNAKRLTLRMLTTVRCLIASYWRQIQEASALDLPSRIREIRSCKLSLYTLYLCTGLGSIDRLWGIHLRWLVAIEPLLLMSSCHLLPSFTFTSVLELLFLSVPFYSIFSPFSFVYLIVGLNRAFAICYKKRTTGLCSVHYCSVITRCPCNLTGKF